MVGGLGKLYFESGLPLSFIFDRCIMLGVVVGWPTLVAELEGNGMRRDRVLHLLNEHIFEAYGKEYRDTVLARL